MTEPEMEGGGHWEAGMALEFSGTRVDRNQAPRTLRETVVENGESDRETTSDPGPPGTCLPPRASAPEAATPEAQGLRSPLESRRGSLGAP